MSPVKLNATTLKTVCQEVPAGELVSFGPLIDGMFEICDGKKCIGLAANQVGRSWRLVVINCKGFRQEIINPVIERTFGGVRAAEEGCMSFPGIQVRVIRPKRCRVSGLDRNGKPVSFSPKNDLICRAILHEVDHLNGLTMLDRVRRPDTSYQPEAIAA